MHFCYIAVDVALGYIRVLYYMSICFPYRPIIFIHWWWIQTTRREVPKTGRKSYVAVLPRGFLTAKAFKHPIVHSCCFNLSFSLSLSIQLTFFLPDLLWYLPFLSIHFLSLVLYFFFSCSVCCKLHFLNHARGIGGRSGEMGNSKVEWMNSIVGIPWEDIKSKLQFSFSPAKTAACLLARLSSLCLSLLSSSSLSSCFLHCVREALISTGSRQDWIMEGCCYARVLGKISPRSCQRHSDGSQR